jgi:hypothetical protein
MKVAAALRDRIARLGPSLGYSQAACGADILFLEALQEAGMQTQIVLPFAPSEFIAASVSFAGDAWTRRFERVMARATRVVLATEKRSVTMYCSNMPPTDQGGVFCEAREPLIHRWMLTAHEPGTPELVGGTAQLPATGPARADR